MSEKQTQTVNTNEDKRTRTIGTQIKLCKTTNIAVQTNRNGTSVEDKRIRTLETRLKDSINKGTQTIQAIKNDNETTSADKNMIYLITTENNNPNGSRQLSNATLDLSETQVTRQSCSNIVTYQESTVLNQPGYYLHFVIALAFLLLSVFAFRQADFDTSDIHSKTEELIEKIKQLYIHLSRIFKEHSASSGRSKNVNDSTSETERAFFCLLIVLLGYGLFLFVAVLITQNLPYRPVVSERRWLRQQKRRQRHQFER
ncbi:uncharacterized protein LOC128555346 [Mercenaria mercenaria]|uniref:uncharacterized protein LOC128555346 n=1 Tax=Mercenaria mercenaria TaxID=6596 RepID=UPI00234E47B0|nr:uncharacterized protein LOC128555346 [Mercenaria mercenaria]